MHSFLILIQVNVYIFLILIRVNVYFLLICISIDPVLVKKYTLTCINDKKANKKYTLTCNIVVQ